MAFQQSNDGGLRELALFAGAGGGILGGHLLGWRTVVSVERDAYAAQILAQRQNDRCIKPHPIWSDVTTFDGRPWKGRIDVVSGGFPCQDISVAGSGIGITGERSGLWSEQVRIVREVEPDYVWMENSPALVVRGLGVILGAMASLGFDAKWGVLSGKDVGAVHLRERIWILFTNTRKERGERVKSKTLPQFTSFPWGQDIRGIEDLRKRSNLPKPLVRRLNHDVPFGVDRLAAAGNAQIPRVAATAWRILSNEN